MRGLTSFDEEGRDWARSARSLRPIVVTDEDEEEFFLAVNHYKSQSGRQFPTCSELLEVLKALGYAKRIWKPVGKWMPTPLDSLSRGEPRLDPFGEVGWYSSVEIPVGSLEVH